MNKETISLQGGRVFVHALEINKKDVADFLSSVAEPERERTFIQALEVGVFCLERAKTSQDTDFVRRQVQCLMTEVEAVCRSIPEKTKDALIAKIGTNEGQVLSPIERLVKSVVNTTDTRLKEVNHLLSQEIDPTKETSTLGRALKSLKDLLDPKRNDSVQGLVAAAIDQVTAEDGSLAKAVKTAVTNAIAPLTTDVNRLTLEVRGQEAAAEAVAQTIEKGDSFEEEIVERMRPWAQAVGVEIHHVGADNRPGDVLAVVPITSMASTAMKIVVEARDRDRKNALGRKAISDVAKTAIAERGANAAIFVTRTQNGLAAEIGEWAEGECDGGPFIACTQEHLITALRFLIVQSRLACLHTAELEVDSACIEAQIQRVRTTLNRVKSINRKVTEVRGNANDIQTEAEALRDEIRSALSTIEDVIRAVSVVHSASEAA